MDESMYIQIVHNIFSNFIKYAGIDTHLICTYKKNEESIELGFHDDGIGIPQSDIGFVKEKFYRVDTARNRDNHSMGIGLSIVEHIMRIHG
jgi:signal transduction histidine kinase